MPDANPSNWNGLESSSDVAIARGLERVTASHDRHSGARTAKILLRSSVSWRRSPQPSAALVKSK